jgi:hypothetical protein
MARVLKEMAVVVSTYEDRNTGQQKNRYKNIGVLMETESNGERYQYLLLDKTFNPAGVPTKAGSDKVLVSLFDQRDRNSSDQQRGSQSGGYGGGGHNNGNQSSRDQDQGRYGRTADSRTIDDEIPF